mgnify:CR=1 FL=1
MIRNSKKLRCISLMLIISLVLTSCGSISDASKSIDKEAVNNTTDAAKNADREAVNNTTDAAKIIDTAAENKSVEESPNEKTYYGDGYEVVFTLQNSWEGGYTGNIAIVNTGENTLCNWSLVCSFDGEFASIWNTEVSKTGNNEYTFKPVDWNSNIAPGGSAEFGFNGADDFTDFPTSFVLYADESSVGDTEATAAPDTTQTPADNDATTDDTDATADDNDRTSGDATSTSGGNQFSKHGRLKVKGRYIVDKNNKKYQLKGISTHGVAWLPQYVNKSAFKSFKKMGANVVRLACYSSSGEGYNTSTVWKTMDKGIKAASDLGLYVIVDWHILNNGNPKTDMKAAKKFFKHFAKKYGKKKNIIWEICNEPNGGATWKGDIKPYAKKMIKLIRKYSSNIIVVGTPTWSQDVDSAADSPLTGTYKKNVCYTIHFYAATHGDNIRNKVKYAYKKKLPMLCTEFSICSASGDGTLDKSSGKKWIKLLKKYKIGYVAWNLSNLSESSALIKTSVKKTGSFKKSDLKASGKWIIKQWK